MNNLKKYLLFLILLVLFFLSCLEQSIKINSDSSKINLQYKIFYHTDFINFFNKLGENNSLSFIFQNIFSEEKIKEYFEKDNNVKLTNYKNVKTQNGNEITIGLELITNQKPGNISIQYNLLIFKISFSEKNKEFTFINNLNLDFIGDTEKIKYEYKNYIPKVIDENSFNDKILKNIKDNKTKKLLLESYYKFGSNYYYHNVYEESKERILSQIKNKEKIAKIFNDLKYSDDDKEFIDTYSSNIIIKLTYNFPHQIKTYTKSNFLQHFDKFNVTYQFSLLDLIKSDDNFEIRVTYDK